MRSLSIGSPLLSTIQREASRSSLGGSPSGMTRAETRVLSALAPRVWSGHSTQLAGSSVTVIVFSSPVTSGDLVVKTTCSTTDGEGRPRQLIEFSQAPDSLLSRLLDGCRMERKGAARLFHVSTSRPITAPGRSLRQGPSFVGCLPDLSHV